MLITVALVLVAIVGLALLIVKLRKLRKVVDLARAEFQTHVGYEYASALRPTSSPTREITTATGRLVHHYEVYSEGNKKITVQSWTLFPPAPPFVGFQLVDAKLVGLAQRLMNLSPIKRTLTIAYPGPHAIGLPALDARFKLYTSDPARARYVIAQPEVQRLLATLATVSLFVDGTSATFADPTDVNVYHMGASRTDLNPAPAINAATKVHLTVAELLRAVVKAR